ncbi:MAG: UDP-N-acetylmuramoyl-L-alanine--D-glutamate ligase [Halanaerobiaceae bacterium]
MMELESKKVAVIGLSRRTGVSVARFLYNKGAQVLISEIRGRNELQKELDLLADCELEYELGGHGEKSLSVDLIVVSPGVPLDIPLFKRARNLGIPIMGEIELAYHFTEARIIAVTGTNGKTTTTRMLGEIMQDSLDCQVEIAGNIGVPLIDKVEHLTPRDWVVVEISSFQLESVKSFHPQISIYLNFTPDHLDRHHSKEAYWQAKKRIFAKQTEKDTAIINGDDEDIIVAARDCRARIMRVSSRCPPKSGAYISRDWIIINLEGKSKKVLARQEIPLPGLHNSYNTAFAVLTARTLGISINNIQESVRKFQPDPHRMELVSSRDEVKIVDDSKATNPDAAIKALESFSTPVILIAGGQDRNANFEQLARTIKKRVKKLILLGETKDKLATEVLKYNFKNIYKVSDMQEAVEAGFSELAAGECFLLSPGCPSWDMYSSYRERGNEFQKQVKKQLQLRGENI